MNEWMNEIDVWMKSIQLEIYIVIKLYKNSDTLITLRALKQNDVNNPIFLFIL